MKTYEDRQQASEAAAIIIAHSLAEALRKKSNAWLTVSGGSTPAITFDSLSTFKLNWNEVDVTLTDERAVPNDHQESNERMVREHLLINSANAAHFHPLEKSDLPITPFTTTLIGMGEDGHFASLFPDSPQLAEGLTSKENLIQVETPSSPFARTSMTLTRIIKSDLIVLLIFGDKKRQVIEAPDDFVINHLLKQTDPQIIWAP